jgi:hypothetical protein
LNPPAIPPGLPPTVTNIVSLGATLTVPFTWPPRPPVVPPPCAPHVSTVTCVTSAGTTNDCALPSLPLPSVPLYENVHVTTPAVDTQFDGNGAATNEVHVAPTPTAATIIAANATSWRRTRVRETKRRRKRGSCSMAASLASEELVASATLLITLASRERQGTVNATRRSRDAPSALQLRQRTYRPNHCSLQP